MRATNPFQMPSRRADSGVPVFAEQSHESEYL